MTRCLLLVAILLPKAAFAVEVKQFCPHDFSFQATVEGNPFDVELSGEFLGPNGARLHVPGFYDGNGVWKIRFSAPENGQWTMRTESPVSALNGIHANILAQPNKDTNIHGRLLIDSEHPYHFRFEDGKRFFLMGYEADWLWGADMLDPKRLLMHRLIDQIATRGFDFVLVNLYAYDTRWAPGHVNQWDFGPAPLYPWEGDNEKPNHDRLNPKFFRAYDAMMDALLAKGIVADVMFKVYNKAVNWPAPGSRDEARYFQYVTARYQAYPNLVWTFSKEGFKEPDKQLEKNLIDLVRANDAYGHLMSVHDDDQYEWNPALNRNLDFRLDQQHSDWAEMIAFDRTFRRRPVVNAEFSYELGVEPLPTHTNQNQVSWKEMLRRAYLIYMAGGYAVYYYNNTAWDIIKPDPEPQGLARWQILKDAFSSLPYWRMEPENALAVGGPCLAEPGFAYLFYAEEPSVTINLTSLRATAPALWINTWSGKRLAIGQIQPGVHIINRPKEFGQAPGLLIVGNRSFPPARQ